MDKYDGLLLKVSKRYGIIQGSNESIEEYKVRIIYSICGLMAYASLWDKPEENDSVSIKHLKGRISVTLDSYKELYTELTLFHDVEELKNEIYELFWRCGIVYCSPYNISPSARAQNTTSNIVFDRGISLDNIEKISGLGIYHDTDSEGDSLQVRKMFGLQECNLHDIYAYVTKNAEWKRRSEEFDSTTEYLRLSPPFTKGYWLKKPDVDEEVSILRTGSTKDLYYLYKKYKKGQTYYEISQLPDWQVKNGNYRTIANACLKEYRKLPPIEFYCDGEIVTIILNYLLPPQELNYLKLYSWPYRQLPSNFKRQCPWKVFVAIKRVLEDEGYEFIERDRLNYVQWS